VLAEAFERLWMEALVVLQTVPNFGLCGTPLGRLHAEIRDSELIGDLS